MIASYLHYSECLIINAAYMERVAGIEPASLAWKAKVLPLYHTRNNSIGNQKNGFVQSVFGAGTN